MSETFRLAVRGCPTMGLSMGEGVQKKKEISAVAELLLK
jgi:hypothetical protein